MLLQRKRRVEDSLDPFVAVCLYRLLDALRVTGRELHDPVPHFPLCAQKELIVLGKISVSQHVRAHQRVIGQ